MGETLMDREELAVKLRKLAKLLLDLGNTDITKGLEKECEILEQELKSAKDEKALDIILTEYNRLSKKIGEESEFQKKWR